MVNLAKNKSPGIMNSSQNESSGIETVVTDGPAKLVLSRANFRDSKHAWLACFCTVVDQVFICGLLQVFGVFFVEFVKDFKSTNSQAAWLGSLAYGIMKLFGPITGFFVVRYNNRAAMIVGSLLCASSLLISSFVTSMNVLYLSYSLLYGIGSSLVINCAMILSHDYFDKHIGWATGLICAGSSIGTMVLAPTSQIMIDYVGWRGTFQVFVVIFILVAVLNCLIKSIPKDNNDNDEVEKNTYTPTEFRSQKEVALRKNKAFILWAIGTALGMFGYYIPFVHLVSYGIGEGIPAVQASYFIMTLGASTTIGRLVSGIIVQSGCLNCLHLTQFCMIVTGIMYMILPAIHSFGGLLPFVIFLGLIDGCYVVLLPMVTCSLVGMDSTILAWGMLTCSGSVTFTIGPPIAGTLYDVYGNYNIAFHVAGIPVICGALVLFFIPWGLQTSPKMTSAFHPIDSEYNIDSGKGSDDRICGSDNSEATVHFNFLKEAGYILPSGEVVQEVQFYLDSHFHNQLNKSMSTSLGDHRDHNGEIYNVDYKSESLPVPLSLMCGPDGMPISVPSTILYPHVSNSTTARRSVSSTTRSQIYRRPRAQEKTRYSDASTQSEDQKTTYSRERGSKHVNNDSESAASDWSTKTNASSCTIDGNHTQTHKSLQTFSDMAVESPGLISDPSTVAEILVDGRVDSNTILSHDCEETDIFKHIFKPDVSETSI